MNSSSFKNDRKKTERKHKNANKLFLGGGSFKCLSDLKFLVLRLFSVFPNFYNKDFQLLKLFDMKAWSVAV